MKRWRPPGGHTISFLNNGMQDRWRKLMWYSRKWSRGVVLVPWSFQHAPEQYTLFIFPDNEHATVDEGLPNCLQHAVFMPPHARVQRLKDEIANAIERPLLPRQDPPFNRLRRCINCACRSVSDAQTKVIYAFSIGLSPHEVAAALNISPKTIHSHKRILWVNFIWIAVSSLTTLCNCSPNADTTRHFILSNNHLLERKTYRLLRLSWI